MNKLFMIVACLLLAGCAGEVTATQHKDVHTLEFVESEFGAGNTGAQWNLNDKAMDICPAGYEVLNEKLVRLKTRHVTWKIKCVKPAHNDCGEMTRPTPGFVGPMPIDCD